MAIIQAPKDSIIGALSLTETNPKKILSAGVKKIILWSFKLIPYYKTFTNKDNIPELKILDTIKAVKDPGSGCNL